MGEKVNRKPVIICLFALLALASGCGSFFAPTSNGAGGADSVSSNARTLDLEIVGCGLAKCTLRMFLCVFEPACARTLDCNARCGSKRVKSEQQACHLVCQLSQGQKSRHYNSLVQCFGANGCLPTLPAGTDGQCPVSSENIHKVHVLESLDEIEGTWLEVRGLNCGVPGSTWEGGYDALPCRSDSWVSRGGQWWYHTSFCAPAEDWVCNEAGPVFLIGEPRLSDEVPGLLDVPYANPPLKPQEERWYVLSRPHPDWIMYTYCGSTPAGEYAGLNVMTRAAEPSDEAMPSEVEAAFRDAAKEFKIPYDDMCITDQSQCPAVTAEEDVQDWIDRL